MKRAKLFGKLGKLIQQAAKAGGPDPMANPRLREALAAAKAAALPKDVIDRNVKKAGEKGGSDFVDAVYEAYGPGGTGLIIQARGGARGGLTPHPPTHPHPARGTRPW